MNRIVLCGILLSLNMIAIANPGDGIYQCPPVYSFVTTRFPFYAQGAKLVDAYNQQQENVNCPYNSDTPAEKGSCWTKWTEGDPNDASAVLQPVQLPDKGQLTCQYGLHGTPNGGIIVINVPQHCMIQSLSESLGEFRFSNCNVS